MVEKLLLDGKKLDNNEIIFAFKQTKRLLKEDMNIKISGCMEAKITVENVITFYNLARLYQLTVLAEIAFSYIERCFQKLMDTENFLELDYNIVKRILISSNLHINSELEVFNTANDWISYNTRDRSKFATKILSTVRFPLLSMDALKNILNMSSSFYNTKECVSLLRDVLENKDKLCQDKSSLYYTSRYCKKSKFDVMLCGCFSEKYSNVLESINQESYLKHVKVLPAMTVEGEHSMAVCLKGEVYVLVSTRYKTISVNKYSSINDSWTEIAVRSGTDRTLFCACAFMDDIFITGGIIFEIENEHMSYITDSCLKFGVKDCKWKEVARMNEARCYAASTLFEGRIVVSGGEDTDEYSLDTVESYDAIANSWISMPNTITSHSHHGLVAVSNKLFVIGTDRDACEIFDNTFKRFVALTPPPFYFLWVNNAISIKNNIFVFEKYKKRIACYDVDNDEWSEKSCEILKYMNSLACVEIPSY